MVTAACDFCVIWCFLLRRKWVYKVEQKKNLELCLVCYSNVYVTNFSKFDCGGCVFHVRTDYGLFGSLNCWSFVVDHVLVWNASFCGWMRPGDCGTVMLWFCHMGPIFCSFLAKLGWTGMGLQYICMYVISGSAGLFIFDLDGGTWVFLVVLGWMETDLIMCLCIKAENDTVCLICV